MLNRRIFMSLAGALAGLGAASGAARRARASATQEMAGGMDKSKKHHVVYHLSEPGKANFVLNNIRNHVKGVGGPQNVEIVLVVHGPGLKAFNMISGNQKALGKLAKLQKEAGIAFRACGNTMKALKVSLNDLPPGTARISQGGVVHIMELQEAGYTYIRP